MMCRGGGMGESDVGEGLSCVLDEEGLSQRFRAAWAM